MRPFPAGHAASPQQMGSMKLGLSVTYQAADPMGWLLGGLALKAAGSQGACQPLRPQPTAGLLFQEAILISLAALQPGLTRAGARPS